MNNLQLERGKSAFYLDGGLPIADLKAQLEKTDTSLNEFTEKQGAGSLPIIDVGALKDLRTSVEHKKISGEDSIKKYRTIIVELLGKEKKLADLVDSPDTRAAMYSLVILENAKELTGRLRANVTAALTANTPLTDERFKILVSVRGAIEANLFSPTLLMETGTSEKIEKIMSIKEWIESTNTLKVILTIAEMGDYGSDSEAFFNNI